MPRSETSSLRTPYGRAESYGSESEESASNSDSSAAVTTSSDIDQLEKSAARKRVKLVDPNDGRCVVLNINELSDVEYTRYVPLQLMEDEEMMKSLEWWWNMPLSSLNLNTRDNVIPLTASMAKLLEHHLWLLLPPTATVERYHAKIKGVTIEGAGTYTIGNRRGFPVIERGTFEYDFVPLLEPMQKRAIHRQINLVDLPTEDDYVCHEYPFTTLCSLKSHLHPKFAILEAGRRVNHMLSDALKKGGLSGLLETHQNLTKKDARLPMVADIARAWTAPRHKHAMQDTTYNKPSTEDDDIDIKSDTTEPRHVYLARRYRKHMDDDEDDDDQESYVTPPCRTGHEPPPIAKRYPGALKDYIEEEAAMSGRKRKPSSSVRLSRRALSEVERMDKTARVSHWAAETSRTTAKKRKSKV